MKHTYLILILLAMALISCDQENMGTVYEPDAPYVAFSAPVVSGNILSAENEYSVKVQVVRSDLSSAATANVELEMNDDIEGVFELESSSITFDEGKGIAYANIVPVVNPSLIDVTKTYEFSLTLVGDNVSELYNETTYRASFSLTFKPFGTGVFSSEFFENDWTVEVEKAEEADVFKILNCYAEGYHITFSVDSENNIRYSTQETGYEDEDYGMVSLAMPDSEGSYYYSEPYREDNSYFLIGRMIVDAGSFGHWYEVLTMN
ncbi:MAG: hypothetical protein K0B11_06895 [Mariniphaga sp.]|nr:hypothetical protein [Mariniphaga sp.]